MRKIPPPSIQSIRIKYIEHKIFIAERKLSCIFLILTVQKYISNLLFSAPIFHRHILEVFFYLQISKNRNELAEYGYCYVQSLTHRIWFSHLYTPDLFLYISAHFTLPFCRLWVKEPFYPLCREIIPKIPFPPLNQTRNQSRFMVLGVKGNPFQ